eukprot:12899804-Prorocentrum_lima.AAC.1
MASTQPPGEGGGARAQGQPRQDPALVPWRPVAAHADFATTGGQHAGRAQVRGRQHPHHTGRIGRLRGGVPRGAAQGTRRDAPSRAAAAYHPLGGPSG